MSDPWLSDSPCPLAQQRFALFLDGELDTQEGEALEAHLEKCPQCRKKAQELAEIHRDMAVLSAVSANDGEHIESILRECRTAAVLKSTSGRFAAQVVEKKKSSRKLAAVSRRVSARKSVRTERRGSPFAMIGLLAACVAIAVLLYMATRPPASQVAQPGPGPEQIQPMPKTPMMAVLISATATTITRNGSTVAAQAGSEISSGDVLEISNSGAAKLSYTGEATTLDLTAGTRLKMSSDALGKRVVLEHGSLHADVAPQPVGQPFKLSSKHGEATVIGTRFTLAAAEEFTRLDVEKGVVKLQRGNEAVNVNAGQFSLAAEGLALITRASNPTAPVNGMMVTGFTLIDASNGKVIPEFDPMPENAVLNLAKLPRKLNIRVNTQPAQVGSVLPEIDGQPLRDKSGKIRNENAPPYTVFGDNYYGAFDTWSSPAPGYHMVTGTPYAGKDFTGVTGASRTLIFKIVK